jgi:transcriptional regulator with XRE-family HTH domain
VAGIDTLTPNASPRHLLGAELRRWRQARGLSVAQLAGLVFVSRELLQKVETAQRNGGQDLITACDAVLDTGGALTRLLDFAVHQEHEHERMTAGEPVAEPSGESSTAGSVSILITVSAEVLPSPGSDGDTPRREPVRAAVAGTGSARIYQFPTSHRGRRLR